MKIGVTQIILKDYSTDQILALCTEAGYNVVELTFSPGGDPDVHASDKALQALSARFADAGVKITSVIARYDSKGNLLSADSSERAQGFDSLKRSIEIAAIAGAGATLLHPGQNRGDATYQQVWDWLQQSLIEAAPIAASHRVHVGIENVWNKFLLSPREMRLLIEAVDSDWIGCYLDTANMMAYGYPEQWIDELGTSISRVHFKDFSRKEHKFVPLMDGDTDWPALMGRFRAIGYDAGFIHEVSGPRETQIEMAKRMRAICS